MRILLTVNPNKAAAVSFAEELKAELAARGHTVTADPGADLSVVLGGDGTLLRNLPALLRAGAPVLPVGFGRVSYFAACGKENCFAAVDAFAAGKAKVVGMRLLGCTVRSGSGEGSLFALNEIVLHRSADPRALRMQIRRNSACERPADLVVGDGLLIGTAIGSGAYNRSCGGIRLLPEDSRFTLTPICPYSTTTAPLALPKDTRLRVTLEAAPGVTVTADSCRILPVQGSTELDIFMTETDLPLCQPLA